MKELSRRQFLSVFGMTAASIPLLSFDAPVSTVFDVPGMQVGYSAITWGGQDRQAIKDIAALGFKGIQLRSNILKEFGNQPEMVKDLLSQHKLAFPMFSSGNANINTGDDEAVIQQHVNHAAFVKAAGGSHMQLTNGSRPKNGSPSEADLVKFGKLINEIGKRTGDLGVQSTYHNHMGQLGQTPEEVEVILANCGDENIKLLLDVAHYYQGGGDPAKAVKQYSKRLNAVHLKDVRPLGDAGSGNYIFVELGEGKVNLPAVFKALEQVKFKGWGIVELDGVPDKGKTPVQCAETSLAYLKAAHIKV